MTDAPARTYSDDQAAALYDVLNTWGPGDTFYLDLVMHAPSVLDVGCGTGTILHRAREQGHRGRLCGVDPDQAMLTRARRRDDIEWHECTAAAMRFDREFELAIMSAHAFQFLATDDELRASLAAIHRAILPGGRFAFETRNPLVREWEEWTPQNPIDVIDPSGKQLRIIYHVESVVGDVVTFTESTCAPDGTSLRVDRASLRFLDVASLAEVLMVAGFEIDRQYGGWRGEPLTDAGREIITIALRGS